MVQINGIPILADIAIGRIRVYQEPQSASETGRGEAFERSRLERALAQVGERLASCMKRHCGRPVRRKLPFWRSTRCCWKTRIFRTQ